VQAINAAPAQWFAADKSPIRPAGRHPSVDRPIGPPAGFEGDGRHDRAS